ncbi:tRNA(His) guanylyltransferase Thg1 family protein [Nostoc sp. NMS8]|nr:tRNA(His) guanylyltransferase Thg1 family protein [Nostoc sp. NMS8]
MRVFETAHDHCVLPGLYIVARLDGRSFTRLTKEVHQFEAPYDIRFRDLMLACNCRTFVQLWVRYHLWLYPK